MNRKNLIDAFGDIDEEIFANENANNIGMAELGEKEARPIIVYSGRKKMNKGPIFAAGAAVCAAVVAVSVPLIMKGGGGYPLSTGVGSNSEIGSFENLTEEGLEALTDTDIPEITEEPAASEETEPPLTSPDGEGIRNDRYELLCGNKELQKAEEKYDVTVSSDFDETMIERFRRYRYCGKFIDGNYIFYSVDALREYMYDDPKTACIYRSSIDGTSGEELLLEDTPRNEGWGLSIRLIGVMGGHLYYERHEWDAVTDTVDGSAPEFRSELHRINLSNNADEMLTEIETTDYSKYLADRYAISGDYIYIAEMYFDPEKHYRIRRYNGVTGETELFKADAYDLSPFKDGIIYHTEEGAFYYHSDKDNTDSYLFDYPFGYSIFPPVAFGGDVIAVNHDNAIGIMEEKDGVYTERKIIEAVTQVNAAALVAPCKGLVPLGSLSLSEGRAAVFYDEENDLFAVIDDIEEIGDNWSWVKSSEDTLCLMVFDGEDRLEKIYTVRKR